MMTLAYKTRLDTLAAVAVTAAATLATSAVGGEATLTLGSVGAEPGTVVRVPVSLSTDDLVGAIDFVVDASGLVIADVDYNGLLFSNGWDGWDTAPATNPQVTAACIFPEDQVTGHDLPLVDLIVVVPADAEPNTEIAVGMKWAQVSDYSFVPYDVTIVAGSIVIVTDGCDEDINGDGWVDFGDLLAVIAAWGPCDGACLSDIDTDGEVGLNDLLLVLARWGACD